MKPHASLLLAVALTAAASGFFAGCSSLEYRIRESFGQQKRELMVARVDAAGESQEAAKEQFLSALEQFKAATGFEGGELERTYDRLQREYERCVSRADDVRKRIAAVEDVAHALFREWEGELDQYQSGQLRSASERELMQTRRSYDQLLTLMRTAERRMEPVLATLHDQVLFLKHNLNARAIGSLRGVSAELEREVDVLVEDMQRAIEDAARFITSLQDNEPGS